MKADSSVRRTRPVRLLALPVILYLGLLFVWLWFGGQGGAAAPQLLVGGDWFELPREREAAMQIVRDLWQQDYRPPESLSTQRLSNADAAELSRSGWVLDSERLSLVLGQVLPGARIYPFYRQLGSEWSYEDQQRMTALLGNWQSGSGGTTGRARNVMLAAAAIDGCLVWPGGIFSFNEATGPTTLERGYENAVVIIHNQFVQGPGGGVCQVASTLHCAIQEAGLKVIERHRHSLPVGYVPEDRDATVSFGSLDLRFENDTGWPVAIRAASDGYSVWVQILGMDWTDSEWED